METPAPQTYQATWQILASAVLILGSGVLHFVYAPLHVGAARGQGLFFISLAFAQTAWGALTIRRPAPALYLAGVVVVSVMPAVLYAATRVVAAPFSDEAEGIDMIGATTFLAEAAAAILLLWHGLRQRVQWRSPDLSPVALAMVLLGLGAVAAAIAYGLGIGLEATAPWLGEGEATGHSHGGGE